MYCTYRTIECLIAIAGLYCPVFFGEATPTRDNDAFQSHPNPDFPLISTALLRFITYDKHHSSSSASPLSAILKKLAPSPTLPLPNVPLSSPRFAIPILHTYSNHTSKDPDSDSRSTSLGTWIHARHHIKQSQSVRPPPLPICTPKLLASFESLS